MTPNDIEATHRSMSFSVISREASCCSMWEIIQKPTIGQFTDKPWKTHS